MVFHAAECRMVFAAGLEGGHVTLDSATERRGSIRPHGVALVLIYPCGKARNSPPGAALKARRRTYEMARGRPLFDRALAAARWHDELEKPDPGFRRPRLAGSSRFRAVGLGRVARVSRFDAVGLDRVSRRAIRPSASGSAALFFFAGVWYAVWSFVRRPFPSFDEYQILALVQYHTPDFFSFMVLWYYLSPFVAVMLCGVISVTVWKVWLEGRRRDFAPFAKLPPWPLSADQKAPAIVIGEVHHPVEAREIFSPSWLTIPERGLYTGVAIFGAVGSGKTSACMNPFARQLLGWQAGNPHLRAAALVLEVKGDFCHDIRQILVEAGRGQDYIEIGMDSRSQWNPLSAWWLDSYSLAYTVSSLINQLFGKGKEPFWQQAYTNLVRWIIELHRVFPDRWVTLQQVYRCAIDPELFAAKIEEAEKLSDDLNTGTVFVPRKVLQAQLINLAEWGWTPTPLPMVVLRRLDCVLEPTKDAVLKKLEELEAQQMPEAALDRLLGKTANPKRKHALYNTSPYTFARLLGDAENIAPNLVSYINGFSPTARRIFERFKFADQLEKLDASNRLFTIVKAMTDVDLHPDRIDNLQMGYLFEHLVMRFNEQANEEAGDHFTPREVIRLMANLIYTGEQDQELVADELATQVDEDRRSAGQARAVLLAAAGRRAFEPQAVRRHAAQDVGAAAAKRVALTGRGATVFGSKRFSQGAVSAGAPFSPLNQRL